MKDWNSFFCYLPIVPNQLNMTWYGSFSGSALQNGNISSPNILIF